MDKSENDTLAVSCVQPIRIFCETMMSSHHVSSVSRVTATTIKADLYDCIRAAEATKPTSFITAKSIASLQLW